MKPFHTEAILYSEKTIELLESVRFVKLESGLTDVLAVVRRQATEHIENQLAKFIR